MEITLRLFILSQFLYTIYQGIIHPTTIFLEISVFLNLLFIFNYRKYYRKEFKKIKVVLFCIACFGLGFISHNMMKESKLPCMILLFICFMECVFAMRNTIIKSRNRNKSSTFSLYHI